MLPFIMTSSNSSLDCRGLNSIGRTVCFAKLVGRRSMQIFSHADFVETEGVQIRVTAVRFCHHSFYRCSLLVACCSLPRNVVHRNRLVSRCCHRDRYSTDCNSALSTITNARPGGLGSIVSATELCRNAFGARVPGRAPPAPALEVEAAEPASADQGVSGHLRVTITCK